MRPKQHKRSPHPGVVFAKRTLPSGDTTWRARFSDPDTKRIVWLKVESVLSTKEARRVWAIRKSESLARRRAELATGAPTRLETPFAGVLEDFWRSCEARLRPSTIQTYRAGISQFERWAQAMGIEFTEDLSPALLRGFRESLIATGRREPVRRGSRGVRANTKKRRRPITSNTYLSSTKVLLNYMRALGLTPDLSRDSIFDAMKPLPVPHEQPEFLAYTALRIMLEAAQRHDQATFTGTRSEMAGLQAMGLTKRHIPISPFVVFLLLSGCRRGEALALRWEDVDIDAIDADGQVVGEIRLRAEATKTKRARIIGLEVSPMLRRLLASLQLRRAPESIYVFGDDAPFTVDAIDTARFRLISEFGSPRFTWQSLRSTCATYLTNAPGIWRAATVYLSARQLGHSVAVAERHYLGVHRGIRADARTLEAAMGVEKIVEQIVQNTSAPPTPISSIVQAVS